VSRKYLNKLFKHIGYKIVRLPKHDKLPMDFAPDEIEIIRAVQPYTMTSPEKIYAMIHAVRYVVRANIPGAIVECGVWRGGSTMAAAMALIKEGCSDRDLYLFDTYEGMPKPTEIDMTPWNVRANEKFERTKRSDDSSEWCYSSLEEVKDNLASIGYSSDRIHFVKGKVEDTIPAMAPQEIALLRLDTDWYESTRHELVYLYPRLSHGGVMINDDYGHWLGARKATDEYFAEQDINLLMGRIDYAGRIAVKP
jgi:O-methyltransferase